MVTTLVELCCGTAAVSLRALAGPAGLHPITGYMGSKRRWAGMLADMLGFGRRRPDQVLLVDAGPWGEAWSVLASDSESRQRVAGHLLSWGHLDPNDLWFELARVPPFDDSAARVAQFLWLQARSAGCIPVWWDGERWTSPSGSRAGGRSRLVGPASGQGSRALACAHPKGIQSGRQTSRGVQRTATVAARILALGALDLGRVRVIHGDVRAIEPVAGAAVFLDPPYVGCPRYAELLPRDDVVHVCLSWAAAGARVAVSEAEPLPVDGWRSFCLPGGRREWVTCSWPLQAVTHEQLGLFS